MSDHADDSARPAKRARLDDNTAPSLSAGTTSAQAPPTAPIAPVPSAIDNDLEREVRAGITEYICPDNLGFTGVLKQRYTDFLVNEIGLDGQVLHLRSTEVKRKENKQHNGKAVNGGAAENDSTKGAQVEAKEEKDDADMLDVTNGAGAAQNDTVKVEAAPENVNTAEKDASVKQQEVKEEPEQQVCVNHDASCT